MNAVLVLILVSISAAAMLAQRVVEWMPPQLTRAPPLGHHVFVVTAANEPSDEVMRIASLLARPDGGKSDVVIARGPSGPPPDARGRRAIEQRLVRHGFDGQVHADPRELADAVAHSLESGEPSLVIVDDPEFDASPGRVPLLVVAPTASSGNGVRIVAADDELPDLTSDIHRRLAGRNGKGRILRRPHAN